MVPGRNQPCPCGSGKKYKRCCYASGRLEAAGPGDDLSPEERIQLAKSALNLGDTLRARRALEPLLSRARAAPEVLLLAASIATRDGSHALACDYAERAAAARPGDPAYLYNLGTALSINWRKEEAVEAFRKALKIRPDLLIAYPNLGHTLRDLGRSAEAIECYMRVFRSREVDLETMSQILLSMHLFSQTDHEQLFDMHRAVAGALHRQHPRFELGPRESMENRKIRIGYVSPRFSREIVGYFFKPLFDHHDRERFDITLYSITPRTDDMTAYLRERADRWVELGQLSDVEACEQVARDGIDVLVDLAGHAPENRIGIFARKPAPLQVAMIDYFDTTGLDTMDLYVTDHFSTPENGRQRFTEQLLYLDRPRLVYEPPSYAPEPRFSNGIGQPLVFGSFNRHHKMVPQVIRTWSSLLAAVPGSRLVLKGSAFGEADFRKTVLRRFAECGVDAARVEFRDASPHAQMLEEYADIDIALDTFPYNGGLTTCEALWMGTPVLTLLGERVISRQTAGMLASIGVDRFTAGDEAEFIRLGQYWARHRDELQALRRTLRARMAGSPLTDPAGYAREFESRLLAELQARG